jgi:hypothetical protein
MCDLPDDGLLADDGLLGGDLSEVRDLVNQSINS